MWVCIVHGTLQQRVTVDTVRFCNVFVKFVIPMDRAHADLHELTIHAHIPCRSVPGAQQARTEVNFHTFATKTTLHLLVAWGTKQMQWVGLQ